jgi:hypothetical protein
MINLLLALAAVFGWTLLVFVCGMAWGAVCAMGHENELERIHDQRRP